MFQAVLALLALSLWDVRGQSESKLQMALSKQTAFVGEPITLRLQISTDEQVTPPDLSAWKDFSVRPTGSMNSSGGTTIIINGRRVRQANVSQIFDYELVPRRAGTLVLTPIQVVVDGQAQATPQTIIQVQTPPEQVNFKLRVKAPKTATYVGEPVEVSLVFYFRAQLKNNIQTTSSPFDDLESFHVYSPDGDQGKSGPVEILDGQQFNTHVFRKILIPRSAGNVTLGSGTIVFFAKTGERNVRDFFGRTVREPVYERSIVASPPVTLNVKDVPQEGRPASFAGHIGEYRIRAEASPTEVNVGDPITLKVTLSGPPHLDHVDLPPLADQSGLASLFKIPTERESGKEQGREKVFTQTIRALNDQVTEIPPLELPYFDTRAGAYQMAKSAAIPLTVHATRVVTAGDAEGLTPVGQTSELKAMTQGIAHNYEGMDVLEDQRFGPRSWLRSPGSLATIASPPVAYLALLIFITALRRRNADPAAVLSRRALADLTGRLPGADSLDAVLAVFRDYLGAKLRLASGALTFKDVSAPLAAKGVDEATLKAVKGVFETCEASRYAGGGEGKPEVMREECLTLARRLEEALK